jgi:hypothetical protein
LLKPGATFLVAEPIKHVPRADFERTLSKAQMQGFTLIGHPSIHLSHTAVLVKALAGG